MSENPFESPRGTHTQVDSGGRQRYPLVSPRAVLFVVGMGLAGAVLGASLGAFLGFFLPAYYQSVFLGGNRPGFDPVAVGVGQGLGQGLVGGFCVGLALLAITYYFKYRPTANAKGK